MWTNFVKGIAANITSPESTWRIVVISLLKNWWYEINPVIKGAAVISKIKKSLNDVIAFTCFMKILLNKK